MFERYNEASRTVISRAKQEARQAGAARIAPAHLLLGVIGLDDPVITSIFKHRSIPLPMARAHIVKADSGDSAASADAKFDEAAYAVLTEAIIVGQRVGNTFIGPEHLLLVLVSGTSGAEAIPGLLASLDVDADDVYKEITTVVAKGEGRLDPIESDDAGELEKVPVGSPSPEGSTPPEGGALDEFTDDLTELAGRGDLDPVIGREDTIARLVRVLARRRKSNPVLIGAPGVGKTAVVEGLAQRIVAQDVPAHLLGRRLYSLDLARLVAGARYRGDFEDRLKRVLHEAMAGNVLLFIDELHTIAGAGAGEGAMDAASILKPFLARGDATVIGATTPEEYRRYLERDGALERRFQPIWVDEQSGEETLQVLKGMRSKYEQHHQVAITNEAMEASVELSTRLLTERQLPDKAVDLLDEAAAAVQVDPNAARVTEEHVAHVLEESTGIPAKELTHDDRDRLRRLEASLRERVVGMDEAISALARSIRRNRVGIAEQHRPMGSFIFAGPTGVGKTELAKALAQSLFGSEDNLISLDMGEYAERHTSARLFGAPPGYVGYDEGGQLTEQVRRNPYTVLLLDEVEKAHPDIYNALLHVLEEGRLADSSGRQIDFSNVVIVMTTNIGTQANAESPGFRSGSADDDTEKMRASVRAGLDDFFRPEFLNRIDDVVVFPRLTKEELRHIVDRMLNKLQARVPQYTLEFSDGAKELLARIGYDRVYGARPLRRVIQREIEDKITDRVIDGRLVSSGRLWINVNDDGTAFTFEIPSSPLTQPG